MTKIMPPPTYDYTGLVDHHDKKSKENGNGPAHVETSDEDDDDMSLLDYAFEDE